MEILKYKLSHDKKGLVAYFKNDDNQLSNYHIHSNELSKLEKWIKKLLLII